VWEAPLLGDRCTFDGKTNSAPFAGSYTIIFPGQDDGNDGPEGHGYGTVKIDAKGQASLAGTLADGAKISHKATLSVEGQWPLHVPLYSGGGSILSWLTVADRPEDDLTGRLSWIKPALRKARQYPGGFTNETMVIGSSYVRPASSTDPVINLTDSEIYFEGGHLLMAIINPITLTANKVINRGDNKLSLSISTSSGLFKGSVQDPATGKSHKFYGALLQKQDRGSGFLLGADRSSRVVLGE
jgi:hypothetical protein